MIKKKIFNVFSAYFKVNGITVLVNENLTNSSLSREVSEAIIKNGMGNKTWSKLEYDAKLSLEMQSNVMSLEQIAMACGSAIVDATEDFTHAKNYKADASKKITLDVAPLTVSSVEIVDVTTDKILPSSAYTISAKEVTFTTAPAGEVKVLPYKVLATGAKKIDISSDRFSQAGELILKTYAVDEMAKITDEVTIYIPKAKPSSNFSISTSADVSSGNDNTTTVEALDNDGSFGEIILTPVV